MNYDTTGNIRFLIRLLKYMGLWRLDSNKYQPFYIIYARILHLSLTCSYTTMMWIDLGNAEDFGKFANVLYMAMAILVASLKVINIWRHADEAWIFFASVSSDEILALRTPQEIKHWSQVTKRYRSLAIIFISMGVISISIAFVTVLFKKDYMLPYPYAVPFDWRNKENYWYAYSYELMAMPVTCVSNCALDMLAYYMLLHVSLCYKLIGMRLSELGQNDSEQLFRLELINCIKLHQRVKSISQECQTVISFPLLIQIISSSYVLCFSAYLLQQVGITENPSAFFNLLFFVGVVMLEIFLPCYFGNEIIVNSNALTNEIYKSNWFKQSDKIRKFIILHMGFLKKPVIIRVGNFFDIGLPLFTTILNRTYGLMALLFNLNLS